MFVLYFERSNMKVWPLESFEEGAEFMETLAKAFDNAHGFRFKSAFAETLVQLLHPVAKVEQLIPPLYASRSSLD